MLVVLHHEEASLSVCNFLFDTLGSQNVFIIADGCGLLIQATVSSYLRASVCDATRLHAQSHNSLTFLFGLFTAEGGPRLTFRGAVLTTRHRVFDALIV